MTTDNPHRFPDDPRFWCNAGVALCHDGQAEAAAEAFGVAARLIKQSWQALDADDSTLLAVVGHALPAAKRMTRQRLLERAIELDPDDPIALENCAVFLLDQEALEAALPLLQRLVALAPDHPDARSALANAQHGLGQLAAAEQSLRQAIALDPRDSDLVHNLALVLVDQGRFADAEPLFRELLVHNPADPLEHGLLASTLASMGRRDEALVERAKAARLGTGQPLVDQVLAEIDELLAGDPKQGSGDDGVDADATDDAARLLGAVGLELVSQRRR
jgi:Flp pilus assembly protein TadD